MSQPPLDFSRDVNTSAGGRTREGLPWSGRTAISRHRSAQAAQAASATRVTKTLRYLDLLAAAGSNGLSDHETQAATGWPMSTVCSVRNGAMRAGLVTAGARVACSPFGLKVTTWVRRLAE